MNPETSLEAPVIVAVAGWTTLIAAYLLSRFAVSARWLPDEPNERSSHADSTPRSGGVAIFLAWLVGVWIVAGFAGARDVVGATAGLTLLVGGVFLFGLVDDRVQLNAKIKLAVQFAAATAFVIVFGALQIIPAPFAGDVALGIFAAPLTIFWIVAFMNAFNFMDGVNGMAAGCGALALFALALAAGVSGAPFWAVVSALAAIALCGFLPVNFPGGRLFMGDNGSQAVGFLIAALAVLIADETKGAVSALFAPTVMAVFIFDVAFTFAHRLLRGRNVLAAHCEHVYQLMAPFGRTQTAVTAIYLCLTAFATAAAIFMLRAAPAMQWIAPAILVAVIAPAAFGVYRRARREGLLPDAAPAPLVDVDKGDYHHHSDEFYDDGAAAPHLAE